MSKAQRVIYALLGAAMLGGGIIIIINAISSSFMYSILGFVLTILGAIIIICWSVFLIIIAIVHDGEDERPSKKEKGKLLQNRRFIG